MIESGTTVEDFSLFGIALSTIANLLVAFGTILLAIYTYKSVKTSEKQLEILQREKEKPQALEQLPILNEIKDDLSREIGVITNSDLMWIICDDAANSHVAPLIFPVSSQKDFYNYFRQNFFGKSVLSDKKIPIFIDSIEVQLHERNTIYLSLSEKMASIEKEIEAAYLENDLNEIESKIKTLSLKFETVDGVKTYQLSKCQQSIGEITHERLRVILKSLIISTLFKPLHSGDYRAKSHGYDQLTPELIPIIQDLLDGKPVPKILAIVDNFNEDLTLLKKTDQAIIRDIQGIKDIYGEKYILTGNELNPQWKNWHW